MREGAELVGGQEKRDIAVVEADPTWPDAFAKQRQRILGALGAVALRIDHVGSTSVAGLEAKSIIDIDLSVPDVEDEDSYLPSLLEIGYELRVREQGHRLVRTPELDVHVHICSAGSDWERRHLLFRDWLRHSSEDRRAYGQLKRQLAQHDWVDMNAYAEAKTPLIEEITKRAEQWATATGWSPT